MIHHCMMWLREAKDFVAAKRLRVQLKAMFHSTRGLV